MAELIEDSEYFKFFFRPTNIPESMQRRKEFLDIFRKALDLALRLLSQNVELKISWFKDLHDKSFMGEDASLRPHPRMEFEEGDDALDQLRLDLVVEPKIEVRAIQNTGSPGHFRTWYTPLGWSADSYLMNPEQKNDDGNGTKGVGSLSQPIETQRDLIEEPEADRKVQTAFDFSQRKGPKAKEAKDRIDVAKIAHSVTAGSQVEKSSLDGEYPEGAYGPRAVHSEKSHARASAPQSQASLTIQVNEKTDRVVASFAVNAECSKASRKHSRASLNSEDTFERGAEAYSNKRSKQELPKSPTDSPSTINVIVDLTPPPCRRDESETSSNIEVRTNDSGPMEHIGNMLDMTERMIPMQATDQPLESLRSTAEQHNDLIKVSQLMNASQFVLIAQTVDGRRKLERAEAQECRERPLLEEENIQIYGTTMSIEGFQDNESEEVSRNEESDILNRQAAIHSEKA